MKLIIAILLLAIGSFAQNTTYKDGTDCECDYIRSDYYESGELMSEVPYMHGKVHGIQKMYYVNGILSMETSYINGNIHGESIDYYITGIIHEIAHCIKGKLDGIYEWYFENGKLAGTATYKNGELVGYKKCTDGRFGNERLDCLN